MAFRRRPAKQLTTAPNTRAPGPASGLDGQADLGSLVAALQQLVADAAEGRAQRAPAQTVTTEGTSSEAYILLRQQVESHVRAEVANVAPDETLADYASRSPEASAEFESAASELRETVSRVRARFVSMADAEIRRIIDETLTASLQTPPLAPTVETAASGPANDAPVAIAAPAALEAPPIAQEALEVTIGEIIEAEPTQPDAAETAEEGDLADLYEGTVTLSVIATGSMQHVVRFVDDLCQHPEFRMLRMTGNPKQDGAEISLGLREPVPFARILMAMDSVASVSCPVAPEPDSHDRAVTVWLESTPPQD